MLCYSSPAGCSTPRGFSDKFFEKKSEKHHLGPWLKQCFGTGSFFWIRLFQESKNPDPIRIQENKAKNCKYKQNKSCITYLLLSTLSFLARFLQNLIKEHHLDPISLLKNLNLKSKTRTDLGFSSPDPDRWKNPDPSGSGSETLD